jgi:hypothetical protein
MLDVLDRNKWFWHTALLADSGAGENGDAAGRAEEGDEIRGNIVLSSLETWG